MAQQQAPVTEGTDRVVVGVSVGEREVVSVVVNCRAAVHVQAAAAAAAAATGRSAMGAARARAA
ncbi:hypothetical protein ACP4OV_028393 [Aristida adscensionis]